MCDHYLIVDMNEISQVSPAWLVPAPPALPSVAPAAAEGNSVKCERQRETEREGSGSGPPSLPPLPIFPLPIVMVR